MEDSAKTKLPYVDNIEMFSSPLEHHLAGVKVHGKGVTFYPIIDTIHKGANLSIYIILSELMKFYEENGETWPEELYLQIDGGAEFANKAVLALCELRVVKRMARVLTLTRLPTGHTHEDIDGNLSSVVYLFDHIALIYQCHCCRAFIKLFLGLCGITFMLSLFA